MSDAPRHHRKTVESETVAVPHGHHSLSPPAAAPAGAGMFDPLPETIGPFRILERIGEGGMGVVYKAEQRERVRRVVALKVIKLGMDSKEVIARFEAERQALALMSHPNVARVLEAGSTPDGRPYVAMEYVPGIPLTYYCETNKLSTRNRLILFISVCNAIQHAHQKGIIHRDLKPSNILVTMAEGKPAVKVIDFGIAKAVNAQLTDQTLFTRTGSLMGTPEYMSPEQALTSGLDVDTRTDVYSLGVILYELLTGSLPFDSQKLHAGGVEGMARMIREAEPAKPSIKVTVMEPTGAAMLAATRRTDIRTLRRDLQGDLDWITLKAMEKDRTRRYDSAAALAEDIRRYLNHEPVSASPPGAKYLIGKFVRKHRVGVFAAGALAAMMILGLIGTGYGLIREHAARKLAVSLQASEAQQRADAIAARDAAERARIAAEAARAQADGANQFLRDLLLSSQGGSENAATQIVSAIHRLDQGWLSDQPQMQAACRIALGYSYLNLSGVPMAERQTIVRQQFQKALDLQKSTNGAIAFPAGAAAAYSALGTLDAKLASNDAAQKEFTAAMNLFRQIPESELDQAKVELRLAGVYEAKQQYELAAAARIEQLRMLLVAKDRDILAEPNLPEFWMERAELKMRSGHFKSAWTDLKQCVQLAPQNEVAWFDLALLDLYLSQEEVYRADCRQMLSRFAETKAQDAAERTAIVCLLSPTFELDRAVINRFIVAAHPDKDAPLAVSWMAFDRALLAYRTGEYRGAYQILNLTENPNSSGASIYFEPIKNLLETINGEHLNLQKGTAASIRRYSRIVQSANHFPHLGNDDLVDPEGYMIMVILHREAVPGALTLESITGSAAASQPASQPAKSIVR